MAGDWIKWSKGLTKKREVVVMAAKLGLSRPETAARLMMLFEWCDDNLSDSDFDADGNASLVIGDKVFIDDEVGVRGFADAMASPEVGWLILADGGRVTFPKFDNHNGNTAKKRLYEQKKKAKQRNLVPVLSPNCPQKTGTKTGTRGEETRGDERREEKNSNRDRTDRGEPVGQSLLEDLDLEGEEPLPPLDLEGTDWDHVLRMAEALGRRVPPYTIKDRRQWFKFAVMAEVTFSENWLMDAAEAVVRADKTTKNRQAHLVAVLRSKAAEQGIEASAFRELSRRIEVPADVWKSKVLEVRK